MNTSIKWGGLFTLTVIAGALMAATAYAQVPAREGAQLNPERERAMNDTHADTVDESGSGPYRTGDSDADGLGDVVEMQLRARAASDEPDQDQTRSQTQDQLRDTTGDAAPDRDQDRDRDRVQTPAELQQFIQERTREQDADGTGESARTRTQAQVAVEAVRQAEGMLGQNGPRMSTVATEVSQAMQGLATREEALQNRSRVRLFLFGQDDDVVGDMQQTMEQNQERIQEMKTLLRNCGDCDQQATQTLVTEIQKLEREHDRLQQVVDDAAGRVGLFGFLFGWMR